MKQVRLLAFLLAFILLWSFAGCGSDRCDITGTSLEENVLSTVTEAPTAFDLSMLPAYSGTAYTIVNNNQPNFRPAELTTKGYEKYAELDPLGRCGVALASCGKEILPGANEQRGSISNMKPKGMLPFENMVAYYIRETENHVAYRVTPIFEGKNLVCSGVQMEAYSIEDNGNGICFNVFCYNVQPGITINYATGESTGPHFQ